MIKADNNKFIEMSNTLYNEFILNLENSLKNI